MPNPYSRLRILPLSALIHVLSTASPADVPLVTDTPAVTTAPGQTETDAQKSARMKWYTDARFGMFIHWGIYSGHGRGEWALKNESIPLDTYREYAKDFTAANYDPTMWAKLAKDAGMKYVIITSKHHDGFALWDSKASDWNAVKASAAKRDLLAPLATAVRNEGLKFGVYYSHAQDWMHAGGGIYDRSKRADKTWDPAQKGDFNTYLETVSLPQVDELLSNLRPDVMWWDTPQNMTPENAAPFLERLRKQTGMITNNRLLGWRHQGFYAGDYMTPEQHIPPRGYPGKVFEVCMTMNGNWGYHRDDQKWKSSQELIRKLSDITSKNGNYLLNIGPKADGTIPPEIVRNLKAIGRWMDTNGQAIHGTSGGPFLKRLDWGRATRRADGAGGEILYVHIWNWPADGSLLLEDVDQLPTAGSLLADGTKLTWKADPKGLLLELPGAARDPDATVAMLHFPKPLVITADGIPVPAADGTITAGAADADCHGAEDGNIQIAGAGNEAYLTGWIKKRFTAEFLVEPPTAIRWKISAEAAAKEPSLITVKIGNHENKAAIPSTGGEAAWQMVDLGEFDLPVGISSIHLMPDWGAFKPFNLRKLVLTPAQP